jgi:hypothetical protein
MSVIQMFFIGDEILSFVTSTTTGTNKDASEYFTSSQWSSPRPKRLIVRLGVTIGSTDILNPALTIPGTFGGTFTLENRGSIQGAGGVRGADGGGKGGNGGDAISVGTPTNGSKVYNNNRGTNYGGGGGGGEANVRTNAVLNREFYNAFTSGNEGFLSLYGRGGQVGDGGRGRGYTQTRTLGVIVKQRHMFGNFNYTAINITWRTPVRFEGNISGTGNDITGRIANNSSLNLSFTGNNSTYYIGTGSGVSISGSGTNNTFYISTGTYGSISSGTFSQNNFFIASSGWWSSSANADGTGSGTNYPVNWDGTINDTNECFIVAGTS